MKTMTVRAMALVASVAFAACGETTELVMGELTEAEAEDLAGAVLMATFNSTGDVPQPGAAGAQLTPFEYTYEFEGDVECPLGGAVAVAAELEVEGNTESEAGRVEYAMNQVHEDCGVMSDTGREFVLNGNPGLDLGFVVENNGQGVVEWGGSIQGAVSWVTGDRTGTCEASLEFSGRQEGQESVAGELAGTVCGFQVSRTFSIG